MATTRSFSNMLNEFVSEKLLFTELTERNWFMKNLEQEKDWLGGSYILPIVAGVGSTVTYGSLASATDIAEETTLRGSISYAEVWASMLFRETDLVQHGKISEQNFLKILPDQLNRHLDFVSYTISTGLMNAGFISKASVDGTAGGDITVNDPERFQIGMKVSVDDDDSSPVTGYVTAINLNTGVVHLQSARSGGSDVNLSTYTVAQNAVLYADGQQSNGFQSLKDCLLSSANGGGASYAGITKATYPHMQAINVDGSTITATNILTKVFDAYVTIRKRGGGKPFKVVMSYKNFGSCLKQLEASKGAYNVMPGKKSTAVYGWTEISVAGFAGELSLVAVQECQDTEIYFLDLDSMKFASNGGMRRRKSPDGIEFNETRATTGFTYIVDHMLFGNLIVKSPGKNGMLYSISY